MNNILSTVQETGRVTCTWVSTGNSKSPLSCVWIEVESSLASSPRQFATDIEVEELRLCA
jgi:hypothetical protein